jgi:PAS domain S-box-containing protein
MTRMTLRFKLMVLMGLALAGLVGFLSVSSRLILLRSFETIEEAAAVENTRRALSQVAGEIDQLSTMVIDFADWDDTCRFVRDGDRAFVETNLVDATYEKLKLNVILFIDEKGHLVYGQGFDLLQKKPAPLPDGLGGYLTQGSLLTAHANPESAVAGILDLPQGPLLVASRPILSSDYKGPMRGSVVMGRLLDTAEVERVARATHLPVRLARIGDRELPAGLFAGTDLKGAGPEGVRILPQSEEKLTGYGLLRDIFGRPSLVLAITLPRDISLQGRRSIRYFVLWFVGISLVICTLGYVLLGQLFLSRSQREAALERYQAVVTGASEGIVLVEPGSWRILEANRAFEEMLGRGPGELDGRTFTDLVADDPLAFGTQFPQLIRDDERQRRELRLRHRNGSLAETEIRARTLRQDGQEMWSLLIGDITERKQAEAAIRELNAELEQRVQKRTVELEAANKDLEAFSYSVSHDLRAPLRTIEGFASILNADYAERLDDQGRHYLARVAAGAQRMSRLVDDLLAFSRLGRTTLERQEVSPGEIVQEVLLELGEHEKARRIEIVLQDLPRCHADRGLLRQLYVNLLANAFKYTRGRDAARVEIGCLQQGEDQVYFVKDNGAGFDMNYAGKLFGVFQRLHHDAQFEGTGVGLSIVKRVVQKHGGRVWAEAAPEQGATFFFTLPAGEGRDEQRPVAEHRSSLG